MRDDNFDRAFEAALAVAERWLEETRSYRHCSYHRDTAADGRTYREVFDEALEDALTKGE